ncbi:MAG: hypothetical protein FWE16_04065 [Firmicutes bacterium]|nr:hypothetical protein [Bacillota bacterium]
MSELLKSNPSYRIQEQKLSIQEKMCKGCKSEPSCQMLDIAPRLSEDGKNCMGFEDFVEQVV